MNRKEVETTHQSDASGGRAPDERPASAEACNNLGVALAERGQWDKAIIAYRQALARKPDFAEALNNLGIVLEEQGKLEEAIACYDKALSHRPAYSEAHYNLGGALARQGKHDAAIASYRRALANKPDFAEAHNNLGNLLRKSGHVDEAITSYRSALTCRPDDAGAHYNLGIALAEQGKLEDAALSYRQALVLRPNFADALNNLGNVMKELGDIDEAMSSYARAVGCAPQPRYFHNLAELNHFTPGDPYLAVMEKLSQDVTALSTDDRIALHFALGKAYDDCGNFYRAFDQFSAGNALKRRQFAYDEAAALGVMTRIGQSFGQARIEAARGFGDPSHVPIFIVGMPRSGSTLVEQILASHRKVFGAGELVAFPKLAKQLAAGGHPAEGGLPLADLPKLAQSYLAELRTRSPSATRITDKMPTNFLFVGLIHLVLPNARIIHTRRNAVDTCLSCFFKLFRDNQPHTYDLAELAHYYRAYDQLMRHWRSLLPASTLIEVDYEALVADLEGEARRILSGCGLEWDAACLNFHKTRRVVRTASASQVREPIHNRSVGRWRSYAPFLQALLQQLEHHE